MDEEKFFRTAQNTFEIIFLAVIYAGSLYPHISYKMLQVVGVTVFFAIFTAGTLLYLVLNKLFKIKLASPDKINLLRTGFILFFLMMAFATTVPTYMVFQTKGYLPTTADPQPVGLFQIIGYIFTGSALTASILFPYFRLINL